MKKPLHRLLALFCAAALAVLPGRASSEPAAADSLPLDDALAAAIGDYFHYRELSFVDSGFYNAEDIRVSRAALPQETRVDEALRAQQIQEVFEQAEIQVLDAEVSAAVRSVARQDADTLSAQVYEWTRVFYLMEDSTEIEEMGFGTDHLLLIDPEQNAVVKDYYDEELLFGAYTVPEAQLLSRRQAEEQEAALPEAVTPLPAPALPTAATVSNSGYYPARGVEYADTYVIKEQTSGQFKTYYNDFFCYFSKDDCVNFVSQCLLMGGLAEDYEGGQNNASGNQWWIKMGLGLEPRVDNYTVSPPPARSIKYFRSYFTGSRRGCTEKTVPSSNPASVVFPGNPVYTTEHMTICTGYNSAGMPILNGHTSDWYHVPLSLFGGAKYTMQIATSDTFRKGAGDSSAYSMQNVNSYPVAVTTPVFSLGQREVKFIWFSLSAAKKLDIRINTTLDTSARLYQDQKVVNNHTLYLYHIQNLNGRGASNVRSLDAGKYYISVRPYQATTSGSFSVTLAPA